MADVKISWGLDVDNGVMRYIADVQKGLACRCKCPGCDSPLIARKGEKNKWCFAHSVLGDCNGESALHQAAKQILVQEANLNNELQLPTQKYFGVSESDCLGFKHSRTIEIREKEFFLMLSGQKEIRISDNLQTDVLLFGENSQTLAVEIFVTHKKDAIDQLKYSESKQSAIEIDLSNLGWDSDYEAIKKAVLWHAPRKWVNSDDLNKKVCHATNELKQFVSINNAKYSDDISNLVSNLNTPDSIRKLKIEWPVLSGVAYRDIEGEEYPLFENVEQVVTIDTINADWSKFENQLCWICGATAKVQKNVNVDFIICLENTNFRRIEIELTKPTFVCVLGYESSNSSIKIIRYEWLKIEKWKARLNELAEEKLSARIKKIELQYKNARQFAREFLVLSPNEKMTFLAKQLKITVPKNLGRYNPNWKAHEQVWKSLVLYYKIQKANRDSVNTQSLAEDKWLKSMTGWPEDESSVRKRSIDLWRYFKELEKNGRLQHASRLWFTIIDEKTVFE